MNIFCLLFFIGIGLYFIASLASLFFSSNKHSDFISMIISITASAAMAAAAVLEYVLYDFETIELDIFGNLFDPLKMSIKIDTLSTIFLLVISISSIIISLYIYTATIKREINISYYKSSFLANLFMMILSFMIFANQSYFLTFLIGCIVVLIFIMLASDFENTEAANKANRFLILGNIAVLLITVGYSKILYGSGLLSVNGFEAALVPYNLRNITFMMIMAGILVLIGVIPVTKHNHIRLLINGLFSKIILFIAFRFILPLFSGNISIICILILLAAGIISAGYQSVRASLTIDGFKWLRHVDLALNSLCFISIIFSMYADNLGYSLIAEQIRISTIVMLLCSIMLYPAITIIIHCLDKVDKSKRFKLIALPIFLAKSLLPPIGGFAGIFIIISNISSLLDLTYFLKTFLLMASVFGLVYVYLFYIFAHMRFFINVIDAGYEPHDHNVKRKITKVNLFIIAASVLFTFVTGFVPSAIGYGIVMTYEFRDITILVSNVVIMVFMVYFLNSTQISTTLKHLRISEIKKAIDKNGIYHMSLKAASFIFLLIAGMFFSISQNLVLDEFRSYSILGVMYIILSIFLLYDKDIDFQDLYFELFMMLAVIIDAIIPAYIVIKILMAIICLLMISFSMFRQKVKIIDAYDRILANSKIYLYTAFFTTYYTNFIKLPFGGFWSYILYIIIGAVLFIAVYILASLLCVNIFRKRAKKK